MQVLSLPYPDPSPGGASLEFSLPTGGGADITIHDFTGRVAAVIPEEEYPAGESTVLLPGLDAGVYFCLLRSGDQTGSVHRCAVGPVQDREEKNCIECPLSCGLTGGECRAILNPVDW